MRLVTILTLAGMLAISACATTTRTEPVDGQADTERFRVFVGLGVPESEVDRVAAADIEAARAKNGYRVASVIAKRWNHVPTYFEYTVKFDR